MDQRVSGHSDMLDNLGITPGEIVETIVTTVGSDGRVNAAPMGLTRSGPNEVMMRPFVETQTYKNVKQTRKAVANIVGDANSFMITAFKLDEQESMQMDSELACPVMRGAAALIGLSLIRELGVDEGRASILLEVGEMFIKRPFPKALSRSFSAAVEAIIHATRLQALSANMSDEEVDSLLARFEHSKWIVEKTSSPESQNQEVVHRLEKMIANWLKRSE